MDNTLYTYIVTNGMSPEDATRAYLQNASRKELNDLSYPLLLDQAKRIARNNTRAHEDALFGAKPLVTHRSSGSDEQPVSWSAVAEGVKHHSFSLPDGRYVTWGEAAVDDHRMRAKWQRGRANSITEDAVRHELVADFLETRECVCLNDVPVDEWPFKPDDVEVQGEDE